MHHVFTTPAELIANVPEWESLDRFGDSMYTRLLWAMLYFWIYYHFATSHWMFALLPVHFLIGVLHGAIVNCGWSARLTETLPDINRRFMTCRSPENYSQSFEIKNNRGEYVYQ